MKGVAAGAAQVCLVEESGGKLHALTEGDSWAIGRGQGCVVALNSRSVSRLHALVQRKENGEFVLVDLGSRNGSFVNGRRVSLPVGLKDQDRLLFGDQQLVFRCPAQTAPSQSWRLTNTLTARTAVLHKHALTTILVVDIRDFTPLARAVSEELLSQTIGTWFLRVGKSVQRMGSWAQRYIGDAVMAVWVHERPRDLTFDLFAVLQAVGEIHGVTAEISSTLPLPAPLRIGAGVNTGPAIVGGSESAAMGDSVNAAFRLEESTKSLGVGIALGERTYRELRLSGTTPFVQRSVELKGYDGPSTAFAIGFDELKAFLRARDQGESTIIRPPR